VPLCGRGAGSLFNTIWQRSRPTSVPGFILIHIAVWLQYTWTADYTDAGKACARKFRMWELLCSFPWGGGAGSQSHTVWPGPRPTCEPSFIFIPSDHLATIHQYHRQTGQRTDSIGRTVFANGRPKMVLKCYSIDPPSLK